MKKRRAVNLSEKSRYDNGAEEQPDGVVGATALVRQTLVKRTRRYGGERGKYKIEEVPLAKAGDAERLDQTNRADTFSGQYSGLCYAHLNRTDGWNLLQLGLHRLS